MLNYRTKLGLFALVVLLAALSSCGGGSGTDNNPVELPTCRDPQVLLDNGTCGDPRPPYIPPTCPEGQIRNSVGICILPDFPPPTRMPGENEVVIYVNIEGNQSLKNDAFAGYNLHLWQDCGNGWGSSTTDAQGGTYAIPTTWPAGPGVTSTDNGEPGLGHDPYYGAFFVIPVSEAGTCGNYIVKTPGGAAQTNDLQMQIKRAGGDYDRMAFIIVNSTDMRNSRVSDIPVCINDVCTLEQPLLSITDVEAHWIDTHTIIWNREFSADKPVELYHSTVGGMASAEDGSIAGGSLLTALSPARELNDDEKLLVPHLASYFAYDLPDTVSVDVIKQALKDELLIVGRFDSVEESDDGESVTIERGRATRIQLPHLLDALYTAGESDADEATLGISYNDGVNAALWAPSAQQVELRIYSGDPLRIAETIDMQWDSASGIWRYTGSLAQLDRKFFRYRVTTYNPVAKRVHRLEVTDPYTISLSTNSRYSQFVNLADDDLKPAGWDGHSVPEVTAPEAMSIYEMHVRDFSINDATTPSIYRGKYMAFTQTGSDAVAHLQQLVTAGLTHVHLLPTNDMSSINEDVGSQVNLDSYIFELCQRVPNSASVSVCDGSVSNTASIRSVLESYDPLTDEARTLTRVIENLDAFNWGYDPYHFNAPEGSYATDPNGFIRIKEKRAMTMALHEMGLRVVMDVVYPHTTASGVEVANSVFDKVVPGYYYRTNPATGQAEQGTGAGPDTATEHRMMGKFVVDSVAQWAREYKIDGFRFDQSGYMPKAVLLEAYDAVKTVDADNYFYAEAWTPGGGSSGDRIAERAVQRELAGTGIGTFNDTLRNPLQQLRLIKGENVDAIRAGLAGNLSDFELKAGNGAIIRAELVGAYNLDPQEAINYVEKHDNETLWDWMHRPQTILPVDTTLENRIRIHSLTLSIPVLSQGVPFIHLGSDLLRSKSMSPNSYNAGDWFNVVDYTRQSNNWAVGLPPELRDGITDADVLALFQNTQTKPTNAEMELSAAVFQEFLSIASSSPLFSLETAQDVIDRVGFHDGGINQQAGVIVMSIDDGVGTVYGTDSIARTDLDANVDAIVIVINGTDASKSAQVTTSAGFVLHSTLQTSADMIVRTANFTEASEGEEGGSFMVPAYTTAIFVKPQVGAQGEGLSARVTLEQTDQEPPPYANSVYVRGDIFDAGWSASAGNEMTYLGKGIYSLVLDVPAGSYQFKVAAGDWSTPNLGAAQVISIGAPITLTQGSNDNLNITITEAGKYRFDLDASSSLNNPTLRVFPDPFMGVSAHVRGSISPSQWDVSVDNMLRYEGNGIYAAIFDVQASPDTYQFKIASEDWATVNMGRLEAITLGDEWLLAKGSNDNIPITISTTGRYRFEVNMFDTEMPTLRVYIDNLFSAASIYLRGTVSSVGWNTGDDNQLNYRGAGLYTQVLTMTAGSYEFKVADAGWSNPNLGGAPVVLGEPGLLVNNGNNIALNIATDGDYLFTLDTTFPEAKTIRVDTVNP